MSVRGKLRSQEIRNLVMERNNAVQDLPEEGKARHHQIVRELREPERQFKKQRVAIKMEDFISKCNKDGALNKLQSRAGKYEITAISQDKIPYGLLKMAVDWDNVMLEMQHRGLST